MPFYKDYFHKHSYDDIKYRNLALNFKTRFERVFGYFQKGIYTQTHKGRVRDYRTPWILLEDTEENARRFARVFHNFNIYTTLNYYQEKQVTKECFIDLAFDFDAQELEQAWRDTLKMAELLRIKQVPCQIFFSGKKGFHILIGYRVFGQEYQADNHLINKEIVRLLLEETGALPTLDMAIYSSRRQLRQANSKHSGSGLFKIPITYAELASDMGSILKLAEKWRDNFPRTETNHVNEYLHHIYLQARQNSTRLPKYDVPEVDLSVLGENYPPCIEECLKLGIKPESAANRNETTMLLATFFKSIGQNIQTTKQILAEHACTVLKPHSSSSNREIINSTKSCVTTVYRNKNYKFNCQFARGKFKLRCDDTCQLYNRYKDIRCSRKLHYVQVEQPEPQPTYTVEEIREGICRQIDDYLADPGDRVLLIKVPAGVGKTISAIWHLTFSKRRIFWVAARKDMFSNIPIGCLGKWKQILGRHNDIYNKKNELVMEANCKHVKLAHILGQKNHNISRRLCKEHCDPGINKCEYFQQFQDGSHHWFVQQPFFFYTQDTFTDPFDLIVIDEDVLEGFKKEIRITLKDIEQNYLLFKEYREEWEINQKFVRDFYALLNREAPEEGPVNENLDPVIKLLYLIGKVAGSDIPFADMETGKLILDKIRGIAKKQIGGDIEDILKSITDPDVFDKEIKFDLDDESNIPLNFFRYLYEVLSYEYFYKHPENNLSRIFFQKHNIKTGQGTVCLENFLLIKKLDKQTTKPIIILDATGKKLLYEKLFGRDVIEYAPQVKLENEIIQVYSSSNSKRSLSNPRHFQRNMEAVKKLVKQEPYTLVVCKKVYEDQVNAQISQLSSYAKAVHFYGIRGSNDYQDFKQVIILGTPQNREEEIRKYAGMLHYNEPRAVDTSVEYQYRSYMALARDGQAPAQKVRVFRDPLLQDILEISREDEIIQAVNRIRIVHDFKKRVVILSNIPLPGLPVSRLVSLEELCGYVTAGGLMKDLVRLSLEHCGFVCYSDIIDPILNKNPLGGKNRAEYAAGWLKAKFGLEFQVKLENKLSTRTLKTYFYNTVVKMGLLKMRLIPEDKAVDRNYVNIYAHDAKDVEASLRLVGAWVTGKIRIAKCLKAQQDI